MWRKVFAATLAALMVLCPARGLCDTRAACEATFQMNVRGVFEAPLDRWLPEICQMARLRVDAWRFDAGRQARFTLWMGDVHALNASVLREGEGVYIDTDLLPDMPARAPEPDLDAGVCATLGDWAFGIPSTGRLIPVTGTALSDALRTANSGLRAWAAMARAQLLADCGQCGACEACRLADWPAAAAQVLVALAENFEKAGPGIVLTVSLEAAEPIVEDRLNVTEDTKRAPDDTRPTLIKNAVIQIVSAIAANSEVQESD